MSHAAALDLGDKAPHRPVTFADTLRSECAKLRTLRSTAYTLLATVILGVGFAAVFTGGAGDNYTDLPPAQQAAFDPTFLSLLGGVLLSQLALGVLGVLVITSEYATGMLRPSLTVAPRRGRLLAAKVTVFAAVALVVGEVIGFGAFFAGQAILAGMDVPHAVLGQPGVLRAIVATGLYLALVGLLGLAVGFIVRSTAGAVTILVAVTFLIPNIGQLAGEVIRYWPTVAGLQIMMTRSDPNSLPVWAGFGLLAASAAATLAAAFAMFCRRDA
jgi:ABC-2 type transport system permease protein